jgi:hypothetical protein
MFCGQENRTTRAPRRSSTKSRSATTDGIREIDIFDYEFVIDRKRALEICAEIQHRKLDILWACRARIDSVDDELLKAMAASGCGRIYFGIESGDQEMLDRVNKGITWSKFAKRLLTRSRHSRVGFFLIGSPKRRGNGRKTLKFAKSWTWTTCSSQDDRQAADEPLADLVAETGCDYESTFWATPRKVLPRWTELSNDEIDELARAYVSTARPILLGRTLKSPGQVQGSSSPFWRWSSQGTFSSPTALSCYGEQT